jgi:hypothetical protein
MGIQADAIPGAVPEENPTPARLEALSDGVVAIIITHDVPLHPSQRSPAQGADVLLLYPSLPGPAVARWLVGRRATAVLRGRRLEGVSS